jgi:hypothetical protein
LLIQRPDRAPWAIAREAFLITISYPFNAALTLLTTLILLVGALFLAGPILFIFFALIAVLQTIGLRALLAQRGELQLQLSADQREERTRRGSPRSPK